MEKIFNRIPIPERCSDCLFFSAYESECKYHDDKEIDYSEVKPTWCKVKSILVEEEND